MANRPTKAEKAQMVVMETLGKTPTAIAKEMGRSHHTIIAHLQTDLLDDPEVKALVQVLTEQELEDLTLINAKGREVLHRFLDDLLEGKKEISNPIPLVAVIDRTFQQRRLLEDKSTHNIAGRVIVANLNDILDGLENDPPPSSLPDKNENLGSD